MANYIVTSARLAGFKPGDIVTQSDLDGSSIEALVEAGHISTQTVKKPAKTKDTETIKD
jgi:hypothetical protein